MWGPVQKGKCNNEVCKSPVRSICKAGPMVQQTNGASEGEQGERVITKAHGGRVGGCTGTSHGWGIRDRGKVI